MVLWLLHIQTEGIKLNEDQGSFRSSWWLGKSWPSQAIAQRPAGWWYSQKATSPSSLQEARSPGSLGFQATQLTSWEWAWRRWAVREKVGCCGSEPGSSSNTRMASSPHAVARAPVSWHLGGTHVRGKQMTPVSPTRQIREQCSSPRPTFFPNLRPQLSVHRKAFLSHRTNKGPPSPQGFPSGCPSYRWDQITLAPLGVSSCPGHCILNLLLTLTLTSFIII